jgi:hypothetical protein
MQNRDCEGKLKCACTAKAVYQYISRIIYIFFYPVLYHAIVFNSDNKISSLSSNFAHEDTNIQFKKSDSIPTSDP